MSHRRSCADVIESQHDAVRMHEVVDRRTFAEKLRIRYDAYAMRARLAFADDRCDQVSRLNRDGRLVDDDGVSPEVFRNRDGCLPA